jgi:hypothetical protein
VLEKTRVAGGGAGGEGATRRVELGSPFVQSAYISI